MPRNTTSKAAPSAPVTGAAATPAILAVVLAAAGFGGGFFLGQSMGAKKHYDRGYATAWTEAKTKVGATMLGTPAMATLSVSGAVTAVNASSFTMDAPPLLRNPLDEPTPTKRTVQVSSTTSIIIVSERAQAEMEKEQAAYQAAIEEYQKSLANSNANEQTPPSPMPPMPFTERKGTLADLKTGMVATVTAATDIAYAETITATEIRVNTANSIPLPPSAATDDSSSTPRPGSTLPPPDPASPPATPPVTPPSP